MLRVHIHLIALALVACVAALLLGGTAGAAEADRVPPSGDGRVLVAPLEGVVDPVMLEFVDRTLDRAQRDEFDAVMFELDTPGGLSTSMDEIVKLISGARLPVYVLVTPTGGRAASAGVFITYSADVAAMSPGTNIGSATPIQGNGQELPKDLRRKVLNDAVAKIREQADLHGRDADFGEDAVREARNVGAREALEIGAIEYVATSPRDLLRKSDGDVVEPKDLRLELGSAEVERIEPPLTLRILKHIVDPNLLFLLFGAGIIGLGFELTHPGSIIPGVAGAICLLTAMFGLSVLPAQGAGIALLVLAALLIGGEAVTPGGGILGGAGAVALLIGALLLFEDSSGYGVAPALAIGTALFVGGGCVLLARAGWRARRLQPNSGAEGLVGLHGVVRSAASGQVLVDGELWRARTVDGEPLSETDVVRVRKVDGLTLEVEHVPATGTPEEPLP